MVLLLGQTLLQMLLGLGLLSLLLRLRLVIKLCRRRVWGCLAILLPRTRLWLMLLFAPLGKAGTNLVRL